MPLYIHHKHLNLIRQEYSVSGVVIWLDLWYIVGKSITCNEHFGKQLGIFYQSLMQPLYGPAIPL